MKINELDRRNDLIKVAYYVMNLLKTKFICGAYQLWIDIGLAFASSLGEAGRKFFHQVSATSEKYDKEKADEKYDELLKSKNGRKNLGSFIRLCTDVWKIPKYNVSEIKKDQDITENAEVEQFIKAHVFLVQRGNKYEHIYKDDNNVLDPYPSTSTGAASEPLRQRVASEMGLKTWPKFKNEILQVFNPDWLQNDTPTECFIEYLNGTVKVTKSGAKFIPAKKRTKMIWRSLVLQRNYKRSNLIPEVARITKRAVTDYLNFQIGVGYALHGYWFRNMAKIVLAVDHNPTSKHDGRRGKDFTLTLISFFRKLVSPKWMKGHVFWTSSITLDVRNVHLEDVPNNLMTDDEMKKIITGDMPIEHKGEDIVIIPFVNKPKITASSQTLPLDYADASIRGRVWIIEYTDYLQKNPPKKVLIHGEKDLSAFDNWMIENIVVYFNNMRKLVGVPPLTDAQKVEALRIKYGGPMLDAVKEVREIIATKRFCSTEDVASQLDCQPSDGKTLQRFKDCYEQVTGRILVKTRKMVNIRSNLKVRGYSEK